MNKILCRIANNLNTYYNFEPKDTNMVKDLDDIKNLLLPEVKNIIINRLKYIIPKDLSYFRGLVIQHQLYRMEQLLRWLKQNKTVVIKRMLQMSFIKNNDVQSIYSKFNIKNDRDTLLVWILDNIDEDWYIDELINVVRQQANILVKFVGPFKDFYKFNDEIGSEVFSNQPMDNFNQLGIQERVAIVNDKVIDLNEYDQYKNTHKIEKEAFGVVINKVLLIVHTNYNLEELKSFLQKHTDYIKAYIDASNSRNNFTKCIRLAQLLY